MLLILSISASADPIGVQTGDQLYVHGYMPGGAPAFWITDITRGIDFFTYCVEHNEDINFDSYYWAVVNTGAVNGGPDDGVPPANFDALDPRTAWIYTQWTSGGLTSYSNLAIQQAIWSLEGEVFGTPSAEALALLVQVNALNPPPATIGDVTVLNLYAYRTTIPGTVPTYDYTGLRQDVLFRPVPEPTTILLLGIGLAGIGFVARKRIVK